MIPRNLRHLRVFAALSETNSATIAAARCHVSQPSVSQAITKMERAAGVLFERTRSGFFPTERGRALERRLARAFGFLDPALGELSERLLLTVTVPQLQALIAVADTENFTLAAHRLGLTQPTVHRAVTQIEREASRALFERTAHGVVPTRRASNLAQAARLAFAELAQADADLADLADLGDRDGGRIVIGALPLSRSAILPRAFAEMAIRRPHQEITVIDGIYDELLGELRRGEIDMIVGALRDPLPIEDVVQEELFRDRLSVVVRPGHPLLGHARLSMSDLAGCGWVVARAGTPTREQFDAQFRGMPPPPAIETGSILLMRGLLRASDHLACVSGAQAAAEIEAGLLAPLPVDAVWTGRPIGLTTRQGWLPTRGQTLMADLIRAAATLPKTETCEGLFLRK